MIEPIKFSSNVSFRGAQTVEKQETQMTASKEELNDKLELSDTDTKEAQNSSVGDKIDNAKHKLLSFFKGVNNVTYTSKGIAKGAVSGVVVTALTGVFGKNIKNGEGKILASLKGIASDVLKGTKNVIGFIPSLITKSPLENVKDIVTLPAKFYGKNYLNVLNKAGEGVKTHKATAALATTAGLLTFAAGAILGKVRANEQNADLDHKTNYGHIK